MKSKREYPNLCVCVSISGHKKDQTGSLHVYYENGAWRGSINYECQKGSGLHFRVSHFIRSIEYRIRSNYGTRCDDLILKGCHD